MRIGKCPGFLTHPSRRREHPVSLQRTLLLCVWRVQGVLRQRTRFRMCNPQNRHISVDERRHDQPEHLGFPATVVPARSERLAARMTASGGSATRRRTKRFGSCRHPKHMSTFGRTSRNSSLAIVSPMLWWHVGLTFRSAAPAVPVPALGVMPHLVHLRPCGGGGRRLARHPGVAMCAGVRVEVCDARRGLGGVLRCGHGP